MPSWSPSLDNPYGLRRPHITQRMRQEVAERYGCGPGERVVITCTYCSDAITIDRTYPRRTRFLDADGYARPELDHVIPLARDGANTADNLVPSCLSCNRSKCAR
jgi:5-methylcytosine-specific restriction endonuclease McrA